MVHHQVSMRWHQVALFFRARAAFGADNHSRNAFFIERFSDHPLRHASDFVHLLLQRHAFPEVLKVDLATHLGQDRERVRIPFEQDVIGLHFRAVAEQYLGAIYHRVALFFTPLLIDNGEDAIAVHGDQFALGVLYGRDAQEFDEAVRLRVLLGLLARTGSSAADVERSHGELRSGFADGLRGNDADGFPALDHSAGGEVTSVAKLANAALRFAGQHRANLHALDTGCLDSGSQLFGDLLVEANDQVAFVIELIFESHAADDTVAQRLDDFARFDDRLDVDAIASSAIVFGDDHVLRNVAQTASQVTRVGGLQRGVGQPVAGALRRDEVVEVVETFAEISGNGVLDGRARGLGHQTAHTGQLADLLFRSAGAGVGHDVNRVEIASGAIVLFHALEHFVRDTFGDFRPDFDDLVVALALRDGTFLILLLDFDDRLFGVLHQLGFFVGHHH